MTTSKIDYSLLPWDLVPDFSDFVKAAAYRDKCRANLALSIKNLRPLGNLGRKPKKITVKNITDALRQHTNITDAANFLGVSRGFIYERVKNPKDYLAEARK